MKISTLQARLKGFRGARQLANNQIITYTYNGWVFESYEQIIAIAVNGKVYLNEYYIGYSKTTSKYLYKVLRISGKPQLMERISTKEYRLAENK